MRVVFFLVAAILAVAECRGSSRLRGLSNIRPVLKRPRAGRYFSVPCHLRILDKNVATPCQFPYQALIRNDRDLISAGSLITPTVVLTNAATVAGYHTWNITLGSTYLDMVGSTTWSIVSTWGKVHPKFNSSYYYFNVAVIILPKRAPIGGNINLVSLPSSNEINDNFAARTAIVAGWGHPHNTSKCSEVLLFAEVTVVPNEICKMFCQADYVIESTLCAGHGNHAITSGDGGAALVIQTDKGYKQIGVASFNAVEHLRSVTVPGGYTRVTSVLEWIRKMAGINVH